MDSKERERDLCPSTDALNRASKAMDVGSCRVSIAESLDARIQHAEESNVRLKNMQELRGLLERNKSTARILELMRELGL